MKYILVLWFMFGTSGHMNVMPGYYANKQACDRALDVAMEHEDKIIQGMCLPT